MAKIKTWSKSLISVVLAVVLCLQTIPPIPAQAQDTTTVEGDVFSTVLPADDSEGAPQSDTGANPNNLAQGDVFSTVLPANDSDGDSSSPQIRNINLMAAIVEQHNLPLNETFYFDFSDHAQYGTANTAVPDPTLHYVPFTYVGTISSYNLAQTDVGNQLAGETASQTPTKRSLFVCDYNLFTNYSWDLLGKKLFSQKYSSNYSNYTQRVLSGGYSGDQTGSSGAIPANNEWDTILNKPGLVNPIKNTETKSWTQETGAQNPTRLTARGGSSPSAWSTIFANEENRVGYRPVIDTAFYRNDENTFDGAVLITLNLNGVTFDGKSSLKMAAEDAWGTLSRYTAPSDIGISPANKKMTGWNTAQNGSGTTYAIGATVHPSVTTLYAQWIPKPVIVNTLVSNSDVWTPNKTLSVVTGADGSTPVSYYLSTSATSQVGGSWQSSNNLTLTAPGTYYVFAKDAAGTLSDAKLVTVTNVDSIPPVITNVTQNITGSTKDPVTLTVATTEEGGSPLSEMKYYYSTSSTGQTGEYWKYQNYKTFTRNGTYYIYAKDGAGNISAPYMYSVTNITTDEAYGLPKDEIYYFDLSNEATNVGTINPDLVDPTLHYVPFYYAGTVNSYELANDQFGNTQHSEIAAATSLKRSLFIATQPVSTSVTWDQLNANNLIFGKSIRWYNLRSMNMGSKVNSQGTGCVPVNNDWDAVLRKDSLKLANMPAVWGQDTSATDATKRIVRTTKPTNTVQEVSPSAATAGFLPIIDTRDSGIIPGAVTVDLQGGKLANGESVFKMVSMDGVLTPSGIGLIGPPDTVFNGWNSKPDGTGSSYKENQMIYTNMPDILYAMWKANKPIISSLEVSSPDVWTNSKTISAFTATTLGTTATEWRFSTAQTPGNWRAGSTFTATENGTWTVTAKDATGAISEPVTITIQNIDVTKPTISSAVVSYPTSWETSKTITVTAADSGGSGLYQYYLSNSSTGQAGGSWSTSNKLTAFGNGTWYVYAKDNANNISDPKTVTVSNIDRTPPILGTVTVTPTGQTGDYKTITVTGTTDVGIGTITGYYFSTSSITPSAGASGWTSATTYKVYNNGTYYVWAKDGVGNVSSSKTAQVTLISEKVTSGSMTYPSHKIEKGTTANHSGLQLTPTNAQYKSLTYYANTNAVTVNSTTGQITGANPGAATIYAKVTNYDDTVVLISYEIEVFERPQAPTMTLSATDWATSVTLTIQSKNASTYGGSTLKYRINGGAWIIYTQPVNITTQGQLTIEAYEENTAMPSLTSTITSKTAKVDSGPPVINSVSRDGSQAATGIVVLAVNATDAGSGIAQYYLSTSNTGQVDGEWQTSSSFTLISNGTYYIYAKDNLGNISNPYTVLENALNKVEQFSLTVGTHVYFNLSSELAALFPTVNTHYVDLVYGGSVESYNLDASSMGSATASDTAAQNLSNRSLFVGYKYMGNVSFNTLLDNNLVFGRTLAGNNNLSLRILTGGSAAGDTIQTPSDNPVPGPITPYDNEATLITQKKVALYGIIGWVQDTYKLDTSLRVHRDPNENGQTVLRVADPQDKCLYMPALEVLNPDSLGFQGLKTIDFVVSTDYKVACIDTTGTPTSGKILVMGDTYKAPPKEGIWHVDGKQIGVWLGSDGNYYEPGGTVPSTVTELTAKFQEDYPVIEVESMNPPANQWSKSKTITLKSYPNGTAPVQYYYSTSSDSRVGGDYFNGSQVTLSKSPPAYYWYVSARGSNGIWCPSIRVDTSKLDTILPTITNVTITNPNLWEKTKKVRIGMEDGPSNNERYVYVSTSATTQVGGEWIYSDIYGYKYIDITSNGTKYIYCRDKSGNISLPYQVDIQKVDSEKPVIGSATVTPSGNVNGNKTITVTDCVDVGGRYIAGYYCATSPTPPASDMSQWISSTQSSHTFTVSTNGTYYVFAKDDVGNVSDPFSVSVTGIAQEVTGGTLSYGSVGVGKNASPTLSITPSGAGFESLVYTSSNPDVVSVDATTGVITGVSGGSAAIIATITNYNGTTAQITCDVIVYVAPEAPTLELSTQEWTNGNVTATITGGTPPAGGQTLQYKIGSDGTWTNYTTPRTISTNGSTTIYARALNTGNINMVSETVSQTAKIDKVIPVIGSVSKSTSSWTTGTVTLTVNATDTAGSGIAATDGYSFDGGTTWQTENTKTYSVNTSGISVKVKDAVGNVSALFSTSVTNIDKTSPTISSVTKSSAVWTNQPITLTVNATDVGSGIATANAYSFDGGSTWQTENTKTYSANNENIAVVVKDAIGNISQVYSSPITNIDTTSPIVFSVSKSTTDWTTGSVTLTVNATDFGGSSIATSNGYSFDGGTTWQTANTKTYTVYAESVSIKVKDAAGNISIAYDTAVTNIDKAAPVVQSFGKLPETWTNQPVTIMVNATDAGSGVAMTGGYSFDGGTTWQTENTKTYGGNTANISVKVKDAVGNISTAYATSVTNIDTVLPTITSVTQNPTQWTNQTITLTVNAADAASGIATTNGYSFDGGNTWQTANTIDYGENTSSILVVVKDAAGNLSTTYPVNVEKIDKITPVLGQLLVTPPGDANSKKITVTASSDVGSGIAGYYCSTSPTTPSAGAAGWVSSTSDSAQLPATTNQTYYVWVKDAVGNISTSKSIEVTGIVPKVTGGTLSYSGTDQGQTQLPTLTVAPEGNLYLSVSYASSDPTIATVDAATGAATFLKGGVVTITATVTNFDLTTVAITKQVNVYGKPDVPTVTLSNNDWATSITVTLTGEPNPNGGQTLHYKIGDGTWTDYTAPFTVTAEGETIITARAANGTHTDLTSQTVTKTTKVDTTVPVIMETSITPDTPTEGSVDITVTASDAGGSGVSQYYLSASAITQSGGSWQPSNILAATANGDYYIFVKDAVGNISAGFVVTIDNIIGGEQFTLPLGKTYYFDLSQESVPSSSSYAGPDKSLTYVPFTYVDTVNSYSLDASSAGVTNSSQIASETPTPRSLFVSDHQLGAAYTWDKANECGVIFGKQYQQNFKLRSLSVGSSGNASGGIPANNEWDSILNKTTLTNPIKNWFDKHSFGQDTDANNSGYRSARGSTSVTVWSSEYKTMTTTTRGFRPALEVLNPKGLGPNGLKEIIVNLNGGSLNGETTISMVAAGDTYKAPGAAGLTAPTAKGLISWNTAANGSGTTYVLGADVPSSVQTLYAQWGTEQFDLPVGGTYYFDLSQESVPTDSSNNGPDKTLTYVPFTYVGMVNSYSLDASSVGVANSSETASYGATPRSLFVSDYQISGGSWNVADDMGVIFGKQYQQNFKLRSLSVGSNGNTSRGYPANNEWDSILNKGSYIKNYSDKQAFGQDTYVNTPAYRTCRGGTSDRAWASVSPASGDGSKGFRPALEVLNPASLGAGGLKEITLNLNGGTLATLTTLKTIAAGDSYRAPGGSGLTSPAANKSCMGWNTAADGSGTSYAVGETVPSSVTTLYAQWADEQYTLPIGETYYFDLSAEESNVGVIQPDQIKDTSLTYVPFTYVGTVDAYKVINSSGTTNTAKRSLFVCERHVGLATWSYFQSKSLLYGKNYTSHYQTDFILRAMSVGSQKDGGGQGGQPSNNEWDTILNKPTLTNPIKNTGRGFSWGQDKLSDDSSKAVVRGWISPTYFGNLRTTVDEMYFRPVIEIQNTAALLQSGFKVVNLHLNGVTADVDQKTTIKVVTSGQYTKTPPITGLNVPAGYTFKGWALNPEGSGTLYSAGSSIPTNYAHLYAQWRVSVPVIDSVTITDENVWTGTKNLTCTISQTLGTAATQYYLSTSATSQIGGSWVAIASPITITSNGVKYLFAKDANGNISAPYTVTVTKIDTDNPVVTEVIKTPSQWTSGSVTLTINATDADGSGISTTNGYSFDGGVTWQNSNRKTFSANKGATHVRVKDACGYMSELTAQSSYSIDNIDDIIPLLGDLTLSTAQTANSKEIVVTGSSDAQSGIAGYYCSTSSITPSSGAAGWIASTATSANLPVSENATYYVWIKDAAGNISASKSIDVTGIVDRVTGGTLSYETIGVSTTSNPTLVITPEDAVAVNVQYSSSNSDIATVDTNTGIVTGITQGAVIITATVTNYDGTTVDIQNNMSVYGVPPAPTLALSADNWTPTNVNYTISGGNPPVGGQTLQVKIGDGEWVNNTSGTISTKGQTTIYARAVNTAFPTALVSPTVSKVAKIDVTRPVVTSVVKDPAGWTSGPVTVTINATDEGGSGIYQYSFDGGSTWQDSNSKVFTSRKDATFALVKDAAGLNSLYESVSSFDVNNIDDRIPVVGTLSVSPAGNANSKNILVTGSSDQCSGIAGYYYSTSSEIPLADAQGWITSTDALATLPVTENGTYYVWIKDAVDNISLPGSISVTGIVAKVTEATLSYEEVRKDYTANPTLTIVPSHGVFKSISYASANTGIATVDSATGVVTGVGAGNTTITATITNFDDTTVTASAPITVISNTLEMNLDIVDTNDPVFSTWTASAEDLAKLKAYTFTSVTCTQTNADFITPQGDMIIRPVSMLQSNYSVWGTESGNKAIALALVNESGQELHDLYDSLTSVTNVAGIRLYNAASYNNSTAVYFKIELATAGGQTQELHLTINPVTSKTLNITLPISATVEIQPGMQLQATTTECMIRNNGAFPLSVALDSITPSDNNIPIVSKETIFAQSDEITQKGFKLGVTGTPSAPFAKVYYEPTGANPWFAHIGANNNKPFCFFLEFGPLHLGAQQSFGYRVSYDIQIPSGSVS